VAGGELILSSRQFVIKNGGRTPTLAKVAKVMCHSKENLRKDFGSSYSQSEWTRTWKGISNAGRNRRIRIAGIRRGFDGRDQVEQIANLFYKIRNDIIWFDCIFKDGIPAETSRKNRDTSRKRPGYIPKKPGRRSWQVVSNSAMLHFNFEGINLYREGRKKREVRD
jgi:hypothetical protein